MIDNELTQHIGKWLTHVGPRTDQEIIEGATMLLRLNRNRSLYQTVVTRPQRHESKVVYELKKWYGIRADGLTIDEVNKLDSTLTPQVKAAVDAEPKNDDGTVQNPDDLQAHSGKRADHDSLPDDIKGIWPRNAERWKKIKQLYNTLLTIDEPCSRYEYLKQLKDLWYGYKADFKKYDDFVLEPNDGGENGGENGGDDAKKITNARSYISKNIGPLQSIKSSYDADGMDEKTLADYNSKLAKVQERVDVILSAGELIGDDLRQTLADLGVVFNDKDKKDNDVEGEADSDDTQTAGE